MDCGYNLRQEIEINYCSRCKIKEADFKCELCSPFYYFCASCDGYVHSMNTKRLHDRKILEKFTPPVREDFYSTSTKYQTYSNRTTNLDTVSKLRENYLNDIKNIYDQEREDLNNKIFNLEKQIDIIKSNSNDTIINLQNELNDTNKKFSLQIKMMQEDNELTIRKILSDKENEIRTLFNKNRELENSNNDLLGQVNLYQNEIYQIKNNFSNKLGSAEFDLKQKENESIELKNFYEKKLNHLNDCYAEDKSKIISMYEKNIEKINLGYKESKDKYLALLTKRDNDFNDLIAKMKKEEK
jgi:hypothetical protein